MNSSRPELLVDWCSYKAAKYAVMHWHYSKRMPSGKLVKLGVWEEGGFVGVVLFGRGAIYRIGQPYGLAQTQAVELVRVALDDHQAPVTRMVALATGMLKRNSPGLRLVVSYADDSHNHLGTIYQAGNWTYVGPVSVKQNVVLHGVPCHKRTAFGRYGTYAIDWLRANVDGDAHYSEPVTKHKYLYPLDRAMRRQIAPLAQPYPKRADG